MCGICGVYRLTPEAPRPDPTMVHEMCEVMQHRGPDAEEVYIDENAALGARRLRVIDLNARDQPLPNEDGTIWVVLNGEIYNHRELRRWLESKGHRFRTKTDTEVLVHLYEEVGLDAPSMCRGMFAFAIYDTRTQTLVLARDRVGQKPLFYTMHNGQLLFGSEMKALFRYGVPRRPSSKAIFSYLHFGFIPGPETAFEGVRHLEPSTILVARGQDITTTQYWSLSESEDCYGSPEEAKTDYLDLLRSCVQDRLVADVPVGLLLSGGIDSCSIASVLEESRSDIPTFTIRFHDREKDEGDVAQAMARRVGARHKELFLDWDEADSVIPSLVWHYEQPFADSSAIPTYHVSRMARRDVTVVLTGDGGDECFGGYVRHLFTRKLHGLRWLPTAIPRLGTRLTALGSRVAGEGRALRWLGRSFESLLRDEADAALYWHKVLAPRARKLWGDPRAAEPVPPMFGAAWDATDGRDYLSRVLYAVDVRFYLLDDLLVKMDRASMANSLEARSPFLDHRMLEFSTRIPSDWKIRGRETKWFPRFAIRGRVPDEVLDKRKTGFSVPMRKWMAGPLGQQSWKLVLSEQALARNLFNPDALRQWHAHTKRGGVDYAEMLYRLMLLELWHRTFVDDFSSQPRMDALALSA